MHDVAAVDHGDPALRQHVPGGVEFVEIELGCRDNFNWKTTLFFFNLHLHTFPRNALKL